MIGELCGYTKNKTFRRYAVLYDEIPKEKLIRMGNEGQGNIPTKGL